MFKFSKANKKFVVSKVAMGLLFLFLMAASFITVWSIHANGMSALKLLTLIILGIGFFLGGRKDKFIDQMFEEEYLNG